MKKKARSYFICLWICPAREVAANSLSDDLDVLCFDEFQITDIQVGKTA